MVLGEMTIIELEQFLRVNTALGELEFRSKFDNAC